MENRIFSKEELVLINENMLGRGMPVTDDGVGYNKADFGICSNYYWGLSDAQIADLSKRLVKYCKTQLGLDKEQMKATADYYKSLVSEDFDKSDGISVNIIDKGVVISFRYNESFIDIIKKQPKRQWDADNKQWIVPIENAITTLKALEFIGADVKNAIKYIEENSKTTVKSEPEQKHKVLFSQGSEGETTLLKFNYNQEIVEEIRKIDKPHRKWLADKKIWKIHSDACEFLIERLMNTCEFIKDASITE